MTSSCSKSLGLHLHLTLVSVIARRCTRSLPLRGAALRFRTHRPSAKIDSEGARGWNFGAPGDGAAITERGAARERNFTDSESQGQKDAELGPALRRACTSRRYAARPEPGNRRANAVCTAPRSLVRCIELRPGCQPKGLARRAASALQLAEVHYRKLVVEPVELREHPHRPTEVRSRSTSPACIHRVFATVVSPGRTNISPSTPPERLQTSMPSSLGVRADDPRTSTQLMRIHIVTPGQHPRVLLVAILGGQNRKHDPPTGSLLRGHLALRGNSNSGAVAAVYRTRPCEPGILRTRTLPPKYSKIGHDPPVKAAIHIVTFHRRESVRSEDRPFHRKGPFSGAYSISAAVYDTHNRNDIRHK